MAAALNYHHSRSYPYHALATLVIQENPVSHVDMLFLYFSIVPYHFTYSLSEGMLIPSLCSFLIPTINSSEW